MSIKEENRSRMSAQNDANSSERQEILDFIKAEHPNFKVEAWFFDIWTALHKKKNIIITNNVLLLLLPPARCYSYAENEKFFDDYQSILGQCMVIRKIDFEELIFHENILEEHEILKSEVESLASDDLDGRTWYSMTINVFVELIKNWPDAYSRQVMTDYMEIQNINFHYTNYVHERELARLNCVNIELKVMEGFIYIATSEQYANQNMYKIGFTRDTVARSATFNNTRLLNDGFYILRSYETYNIQKTEQLIHHLLSDYRHSKLREFFELRFRRLEGIVKFTIKQINEIYDYVNDKKKKQLKNPCRKSPFIPKPENINKQEKELDKNERMIIEVMKAYRKNGQRVIKRAELLNNLKFGNSRREKWKFVKKFLKWKHTKKSLRCMGHRYRIVY